MSEIQLIAKPRVYLVGELKVNREGWQSFIRGFELRQWEENLDNPSVGEAFVEGAARLCYWSYGKGRKTNREHIGHLIEVGHGSCLEHAVYSLVITGISRSCSHQLVRHRVGISPSQLSQRFYDESETSFVVPPSILNEGGKALQFFRESCEDALSRYIHLVAVIQERVSMTLPEEKKTLIRKRAREAARSVLPESVETRIWLTGNARAWRHFIEMRGSEEADREINRLAVAVAKKLISEAPNIFQDYTVSENEDGTGVVTTPHRKV